MISVKRRWPLGLLLVGAFSALLGAGCRQSHGGSGDAQVRLINAVPDAGALTVSVDGRPVWRDAPYRSSTGYQRVAAGSYPVRVEAAGEGVPLVDRPLSFEAGHRYTVLALGAVRGSAAPPQVQVFGDDAAGEGLGDRAGVRLVNGAAGLAPVDLVVNSIVGLKAVPFGGRSDPLPLAAGPYDLKIVAADTPDALAGPIRLRLEAGRAYTLVAMGQGAGLTLEAYPDTP